MYTVLDKGIQNTKVSQKSLITRLEKYGKLIIIFSLEMIRKSFKEAAIT